MALLPSSGGLPRRRGSRLVAIAIGVGLLFLFKVNARGINSIDSAVNQYTALSIASTGTVNLDRYPLLVKSGIARHYIEIIDGHARSLYPVLPPLLAAPAYRLGIAAGLINPVDPAHDRIEAIGAAAASLFVSLACAFLYLTIARWRPGAPAAAIAIAVGAATPLWSSASQALWSHAPAVVLLSAALYALLVPPGQRRHSLSMFVGGGLIVLAAACRPLLVVFPVGMALGLWRSRDAERGVAAFVAGAAVAACAVIAMNVAIFGTWAGGQARLYAAGVGPETHGVVSAWSGQWLDGLAGVLASPSRGLLVYMPVVMVAGAGMWRAWREGGVARYGLAAATVAFVLLWAKYAVWWGGQSYGPRFAADIAIPLGLLAAFALTGWSRGSAGWRGMVLAATVWSVGVQTIGALCYPGGAWDSLPRDVDTAHERLWDWQDSQIVRTVAAGLYLSRRVDRPVESEPTVVATSAAESSVSGSSGSPPAPALPSDEAARVLPPPDAQPAPVSGSSR